MNHVSRKRKTAAAAAFAALAGLLGAVPAFASSVAYPDLSLGKWWMPPAISSLAVDVDKLAYLIFGMCIGLSVIVFGVMAISLVRDRVPADGPFIDGPPAHGNTPLEIAWTIGPVIIVIIILWTSYVVQQKFDTLPANAPTVNVTGYQWGWRFAHDGITEDNVLHMPVNKPEKVSLSAVDVIHSFFVPDMRVKQDLVPGITTWTWIDSNRPGDFLVVCAEYCGDGHAYMRAHIVVMTQADYDAWLAAQKSSAGGQ